MRYFLLLVVVAILAIVATFWLTRRVNYVGEFIGDVQALWNDNELYLFVQTRKSSLNGRRFDFFRQLMGIMHPLPKELEHNVIVFRFRDSTQERFHFGERGGSAFPYNGTVYYSSVDSGWKRVVWRLEEGKFHPLNEGEGNQILESFSSNDELLQREGWESDHLLFVEGNKTYRIKVGEKDFFVTLIRKPMSKSRNAFEYRIELTSGEREEGKLLVEIDSSWKRGQ